MPKQLTLDLTPEQRQEFVGCRDHHRLPYLRERAAALLLLADRTFSHRGGVSLRTNEERVHESKHL